MKSIVRIGIVGAGKMGCRHAKLVADSKFAALAGFADRDPTVALNSVFEKIRCYQDHLQLIKAEVPDGIIIATPNAQHFPVAMDCLAEGIPILIEKPITDNVESGRALVAEQRKSGVSVLVGHHRRFDPAVDVTKRLLSDGHIGNLLAVQSTWAIRKPDNYYQVKWRKDRSSGGFILINLIHDIDVLRYLCGEILSVYADVGTIGRSLPVADTAAVTLRFKNGVLGTVTASDACVSVWGWEQATGENPIVPAAREGAVRFFGTNGSLDFPTLKLWRDATDGAGTWDRVLSSETIPLDHDRHALADQFRHFCDLIKNDEKMPKVTAEDGLGTLIATTAILESAESKSPILID